MLGIMQTKSSEMIKLDFQDALNSFINERDEISITKRILSLKNAFVDSNGAV